MTLHCCNIAWIRDTILFTILFKEHVAESVLFLPWGVEMAAKETTNINKNTLKVTKPICKLRIQDASIMHRWPHLKDNLHFLSSYHELDGNQKHSTPYCMPWIDLSNPLR